MKVQATEYLRVDLNEEQWECNRCDHVLGSARENYKHFLLIHDRDRKSVV